MELLLKFLSACLVLAAAEAFSCFTCNNKPNEDDTQNCEERVEECAPGIESCSSVVFKSKSGKMHFRKFCTAPGTPIYQYLMFFPGSALCQNIETNDVPPAPPAQPIVVNGTVIHPPAPPAFFSSTMLCVCTKPRCNSGTYREVMERTMLQNIEVPKKKFAFGANSILGKKSQF